MLLSCPDEEFAQALKFKTGSAVKLVLAGPHADGMTLRKSQKCPRWATEADRMKRWLEKAEPEKHAEWEPLLRSLAGLGFPRFRANLKVLRSQDGDVQRTIEVLKERKLKAEDRLRQR